MMPSKLDPKSNASPLTTYEIKVEGHLGHEWTDWFGGLLITLEETGNTVLAGPVVDQAALYGLLKKVRDLGLPLISVVRLHLIETQEQETNSLPG